MNKWINVNDELPEGQEDVLCYSNKNGGYFFIGCMSYNHEYWCQDGFMHCYDVTHWMPIVEPPIDV